MREAIPQNGRLRRASLALPRAGTTAACARNPTSRETKLRGMWGSGQKYEFPLLLRRGALDKFPRL